MKFDCAIAIIAALYFIASALVKGYVSGLRKEIPRWAHVLLSCIVALILALLLMLASKCGCTSDEYSPDGKSTIEHYEPRY